MKELMEWYSQISNFKRLKISDAKEIYLKAINESDETLKKEYWDRLITGTLYVVYNYVNKQNFELFQSSSYDMNDVINLLDFFEIFFHHLYWLFLKYLLNQSTYQGRSKTEIFNLDVYKKTFAILNKVFENNLNVSAQKFFDYYVFTCEKFTSFRNYHINMAAYYVFVRNILAAK